MIIPVSLEKDSYEIVLERGSLPRAAELLGLHGRVFIVTDSGVPAEYAACVAAQCERSTVHCIPQGESSKSMEMFTALLRAMVEAGLSRSDCVVAVGGGVVGDLSGFAAACYMRGIDFYNIPTTLLSQVDSSIGGKTAIDFAGVKNIVGAFYQPKRVLIDPDTLKTLSPRLLHEGLAEAIKMALTCDAELFDTIAASPMSGALLDQVIERSLRIKADVVEQDPHESGLRRILDFGHTVGHAVESHANGALLHGECVALGMLPFCSEAVRQQLLPVLRRFELPCEIPASGDVLLPYLTHDKKNTGRGIITVQVEKPGSFVLREMSVEDICAKLEVLA